MLVALQNHEKITKNPCFEVQGHRCWYPQKACQ